jgi:hypothetical protein
VTVVTLRALLNTFRTALSLRSEPVALELLPPGYDVNTTKYWKLKESNYLSVPADMTTRELCRHVFAVLRYGSDWKSLLTGNFCFGFLREFNKKPVTFGTESTFARTLINM